jgi:hypothetical protein
LQAVEQDLDLYIYKPGKYAKLYNIKTQVFGTQSTKNNLS